LHLISLHLLHNVGCPFELNYFITHLSLHQNKYFVPFFLQHLIVFPHITPWTLFWCYYGFVWHSNLFFIANSAVSAMTHLCTLSTVPDSLMFRILLHFCPVVDVIVGCDHDIVVASFIHTVSWHITSLLPFYVPSFLFYSNATFHESLYYLDPLIHLLCVPLW